MKNWDKVREMLERYYEGESSVAEEQELRLLLQDPALPADLKAEAQLLHWPLAERQVAAPLSEESLLARLPLEEEKPVRTLHRLWPYAWQAAAAVALLLIGFAIGKGGAPADVPAQTTTTNTSTELMALRQELSEVKELLQGGGSTGQRLQAVNVAALTPQADAELLMALIHTLHFDENVNVRLAAVEALLNYQQHPQVRRALVHSLGIQTDPNVQLALIHGLTRMGEKAAVPQLLRLLEEQELQQVVRQQINESISILI
jgi:HEAT repeat protein